MFVPASWVVPTVSEATAPCGPIVGAAADDQRARNEQRAGSQVTTTDIVAAQAAVGSPSEMVAVRVTGPGVVQTKVGVAVVAPVKDPEGADQE